MNTVPIKKFLFFILILSMQFDSSTFAEDWVYTVRKGDTLWDLCLEYTTEKNCWFKVGPYNQVDFPPSLAPGTRIRFPAAWLKNQPLKVELVYFSGNVLVNENALAGFNPQAAELGMRLGVGAHLQTASESTATLKFADESILVLEENSEISFDLLSQQGATGMVDSRLRLLRGATSVQVRKREPRSRFSITSPSAVAAVRGTKFRVSTVSENESIMLGSVYAGAIAVNARNKDGSIREKNAEVPAGFGISAKQGQPLPRPSELLPATEFNIPPGPHSLPLTVRWQKVVGAQRYRLQILFDSEEDKLIRSFSLEEPRLTDTVLENGCYRLRVNAMDEYGLLGMPAETRLCAATPPPTPLISQAVLDAEKNISVGWDQMQGRLRFEIEIARDPKFSALIHREQVVENAFRFPLQSEKALYLRVRTIGEYGVLSEYSKTAKVSGKNRDLEALLFIFLPILLSL